MAIGSARIGGLDSYKDFWILAYDAVQLAAALIVQAMRGTLGLSALELVSADHDLNDAATAEELTVDNPNSH
jgi:hypothetical protein